MEKNEKTKVDFFLRKKIHFVTQLGTGVLRAGIRNARPLYGRICKKNYHFFHHD